LSGSFRGRNGSNLESGAFVNAEATSPDGSARGHAIAHDGSNVLHLLLAETVKANGQFVVHLIVDGSGDHDATGLGELLQPRRDVDPVAKDVGAVHHHIAQIDADAKPHLLRVNWVGILIGNLLLNLDRALHGLDDAGKLGDHGIAPGIHDPPVMTLHQSCNGAAVAAQRPQRSRFICSHEARIAVHIGAQDGGQPPFHLVIGHRPHGSLTDRQMHQASSAAIAVSGLLQRALSGSVARAVTDGRRSRDAAGSPRPSATSL